MKNTLIYKQHISKMYICNKIPKYTFHHIHTKRTPQTHTHTNGQIHPKCTNPPKSDLFGKLFENLVLNKTTALLYCHKKYNMKIHVFVCRYVCMCGGYTYIYVGKIIVYTKYWQIIQNAQIQGHPSIIHFVVVYNSIQAYYHNTQCLTTTTTTYIREYIYLLGCFYNKNVHATTTTTM